MKDITKLRIGVIPVFDRTPTKYKILIDNIPLFESKGMFVSGQVQYHDLAVELESGAHTLDIRIDPTNEQFENIEIVEVAFQGHRLSDKELFLMSQYHLDEPRLIDNVLEHTIDQCTVIGWSGVYRIKFTTPILAWILRNF